MRSAQLPRYWLLFTISLPLAAVLLFPHTLWALSAEQKRVLDSHVGYFNVEEKILPRACGNSSTLAGSDNAEKIWNFFIGQGFKPHQAAGIMGNMQHESRLEPRLVEFGYPNSRGEISVDGQPSSLDDNIPPEVGPQGQPGYGLIQWTSPGRKQGLRDLVAVNGVKGSDLGTQLQYVMKELNGSYYKQYALDPLLASEDYIQATDIILENYEIPGDIEASRQIRRDNAKRFLDKFSSTGGAITAPPGTSVCGSGGSGEVVNGYSLPVNKEFYKGSPKHHDYAAVDIALAEGTNVYAVTSGTITVIEPGSDCGNGLILDRGDGVQFKYCHGKDGGSVPSAKNGNTVQAGNLIMYSGNTGDSEGPHLHLEVRVDGELRCPGPLLDGIANGSPPDPKTLPTTGCVT